MLRYLGDSFVATLSMVSESIFVCCRTRPDRSEGPICSRDALLRLEAGQEYFGVLALAGFYVFLYSGKWRLDHQLTHPEMSHEEYRNMIIDSLAFGAAMASLAAVKRNLMPANSYLLWFTNMMLESVGQSGIGGIVGFSILTVVRFINGLDGSDGLSDEDFNSLFLGSYLLASAIGSFTLSKHLKLLSCCDRKPLDQWQEIIGQFAAGGVIALAAFATQILIEHGDHIPPGEFLGVFLGAMTIGLLHAFAVAWRQRELLHDDNFIRLERVDTPLITPTSSVEEDDDGEAERRAETLPAAEEKVRILAGGSSAKRYGTTLTPDSSSTRPAQVVGDKLTARAEESRYGASVAGNSLTAAALRATLPQSNRANVLPVSAFLASAPKAGRIGAPGGSPPDSTSADALAFKTASGAAEYDPWSNVGRERGGSV